MTKDKKNLLGSFNLQGVPPAPRGVTNDQNRHQNIDRMVADVEKFKAEDDAYRARFSAKNAL